MVREPRAWVWHVSVTTFTIYLSKKLLRGGEGDLLVDLFSATVALYTSWFSMTRKARKMKHSVGQRRIVYVRKMQTVSWGEPLIAYNFDSFVDSHDHTLWSTLKEVRYCGSFIFNTFCICDHSAILVDPLQKMELENLRAFLRLVKMSGYICSITFIKSCEHRKLRLSLALAKSKQSVKSCLHSK